MSQIGRLLLAWVEVFDLLARRAVATVWARLRRAVLRAFSARAVVIWWHDDGSVEVENRTDWPIGHNLHADRDAATLTLWRAEQRP